ncbi:MAG: hypothetical protein H2069_09010 [Legionella sp.]|nr:hypothetical protein [Legionella sp.]
MPLPHFRQTLLKSTGKSIANLNFSYKLNNASFFTFSSAQDFPPKDIYARFLKQRFSKLSDAEKYLASRANNKALFKLMEAIKSEGLDVLKTINTAYLVNQNVNQMHYTEVVDELIEGMGSSLKELPSTPPENEIEKVSQRFYQAHLINMVNAHLDDYSEKTRLREFGICKELVLAWYFFNAFEKNFLGECNAIIDRLRMQDELTSTQESLITLLLQIQNNGYAALGAKGFRLSSICPMEEYLKNLLRYQHTTYVDHLSAEVTCGAFSQQLIQEMSDLPEQLRLIYVGEQAKDNITERSHVMGCMKTTENDGRECFAVFDPNVGVYNTNEAKDAERVLGTYLSDFLTKLDRNYSHGKFFVRNTLPFTMQKTNTVEEQEVRSVFYKG